MEYVNTIEHNMLETLNKNKMSNKKQQTKIKKLSEKVEKLKNDLDLTNEMSVLIERTMNLNLQMTEFHLKSVKENTGEILIDDINYCINLSKRIVDFYKKRTQ